ncbi:hypothetical protein [uncultured Clostridium sp.]|uniref:hypothetical protein n=1 Tax=uncultured Clostridium sp. TaxID=59620 RepID=UPI0028EC0D7A|nr:hypothetical protein [uncultured Clostridium sp.]
MEISEERLRELIIKAIELFKSESSIQNTPIDKKKLFVICTDEWNSLYWNFFERLDKENKYDVHIVIPSNIKSEFYLNNLKKFNVCRNIIYENDLKNYDLTEYITVFPVVPRSLIVKTALCIEDTFETKWIFESMEKGQQIIFLQSGLRKFTGKEPKNYVKKMLDYYRTLLEFDIEISEDIEERIEEKSDFELVDYKNTYYDSSLNKEYSKKIITEKEIENYILNKKIVLNKGDIITEMAKDKARNLNISIIRM